MKSGGRESARSVGLAEQTVEELVVWSFRKNNKLIVEVHSWSPDVGC